MHPLLALLALTASADPHSAPGAAPLRAPSAEEQRLFDEGSRALAAGNPGAAQQAWQAGYAIARDPAFLVHIGEAQEKAGQPSEAAETYRRYLQLAPDTSDRAEIEGRLARLGAPAAPPNAAAPPTPAAEETPGEFGAAPPRTVPPPPASSPARDAELPTRRAQSEEEEAGPWSAYKITAGFATAAAVTLLGTAGLFAASAASDADDINRLIAHRDDRTGAPLVYSSVADQYEEAMADGDRHDRYAKIALIGAAGAAAVAATFFILDSRRGNEPKAALVPAGRGLAAAGVWRF